MFSTECYNVSEPAIVPKARPSECGDATIAFSARIRSSDPALGVLCTRQSEYTPMWYMC